MNTLNRYLLLGTVLGTAFPAFTFAQQSANSRDSAHEVFAMTNSAQENEVIAYERTPFGTLHDPHAYRTDGHGSGGKVDPLASQGSLTLSKDRSLLFAVNAGSGTVSAFRVEGARLVLADRISTEGSEPNSVTQHGNALVTETGPQAPKEPLSPTPRRFHPTQFWRMAR